MNRTGYPFSQKETQSTLTHAHTLTHARTLTPPLSPAYGSEIYTKDSRTDQEYTEGLLCESSSYPSPLEKSPGGHDPPHPQRWVPTFEPWKAKWTALSHMSISDHLQNWPLLIDQKISRNLRHTRPWWATQ